MLSSDGRTIDDLRATVKKQRDWAQEALKSIAELAQERDRYKAALEKIKNLNKRPGLAWMIADEALGEHPL